MRGTPPGRLLDGHGLAGRPGAEDLLKAVASLHSSNIFHLALSPESVRLRTSAGSKIPTGGPNELGMLVGL